MVEEAVVAVQQLRRTPAEVEAAVEVAPHRQPTVVEAEAEAVEVAARTYPPLPQVVVEAGGLQRRPPHRRLQLAPTRAVVAAGRAARSMRPCPSSSSCSPCVSVAFPAAKVAWPAQAHAPVPSPRVWPPPSCYCEKSRGSCLDWQSTGPR